MSGRPGRHHYHHCPDCGKKNLSCGHDHRYGGIPKAICPNPSCTSYGKWVQPKAAV